MSKKIRGKDFVIYLEKEGVQTPICCGKDLVLNITHEVKEATKAPQSKWKSFIEGERSYTVSSSQLVLLQPERVPPGYVQPPDAPGIRLKDIFAHLVSGNPVKFVMGNHNLSGLLVDNSMFFSGQMIIDSLQVNGSDSEISTYSFTGIGDGVLSATNPYKYTVIASSADGSPVYGAPLTAWSPLLPIDLTTDC